MDDGQAVGRLLAGETLGAPVGTENGAEVGLSPMFTSQQEANLRPFLLHVLVTERKRWTTIDLVVDGPRCTCVVIVGRGLVHS